MNIQEQFPILKQRIHGYPLTYLDNAATTQKPLQVIECLQQYYETYNANVHRGIHTLTALATDKYEQAREKVRGFINAKSTKECIFVRGTTEGINLVAHSFALKFLKPNDEVIISQIEHHSNIVPWQMACEISGAHLIVIPCNDQGELLLDEYKNLLNERTKLVAITHISNALGTINPLEQIIELAHLNNTPVLVDGAQATPHLKIDVQALDCDFYAFSGHKMYGPSGIGVLYGKYAYLERLLPYQTGGDMIQSVSFNQTTFNQLPYKFEAGTPSIADAIALGEAILFLQTIGLDKIQQHEMQLLDVAKCTLGTVPNIIFYGTARHKAPIISFNIKNLHPHDIGTFLDQKGIAVRTGHLCAQPTMTYFHVNAMVRASMGLYNTVEEIERLTQTLHEIERLFKL